MKFQNVILKTDYLIAVNEMIKKQDSFYECASIFQDIQYLSLEFVSYSVRHVDRGVNVLAHNIAKVQCEIGDRKI